MEKRACFLFLTGSTCSADAISSLWLETTCFLFLQRAALFEHSYLAVVRNKSRARAWFQGRRHGCHLIASCIYLCVCLFIYLKFTSVQQAHRLRNSGGPSHKTAHQTGSGKRSAVSLCACVCVCVAPSWHVVQKETHFCGKSGWQVKTFQQHGSWIIQLMRFNCMSLALLMRA